MAGRQARRRLIVDAGFALALAAGVVLFAAWPGELDGTPLPAPAGAAAAPEAPRYDALLADGRITVAALFLRMDEDVPLARDPGAWSYQALLADLEARGFRRTAFDPAADAVTLEGAMPGGPRLVVDLLGPRSLPHYRGADVTRRLAAALDRHEIVYYDGHAFRGRLLALRLPPAADRPDYQIVLLDTCWSRQHYGAAFGAVAPTVDLVSNGERSITGSVESFAAFLVALKGGASWPALLSAMNRPAEARAAGRAAAGAGVRFRLPERFAVSRVAGYLPAPTAPTAPSETISSPFPSTPR